MRSRPALWLLAFLGACAPDARDQDEPLAASEAAVQPCDPAAFTTRCNGNSLVICDGNREKTRVCGAAVCNAVAASCGYCGDGTRDPGEQCDDANTNDFDGCRADCTQPPPPCNPAVFVARCDGATLVRCPAGFETRTACGAARTCNAAAESCGYCGDGTRDPGEQCDDANTNDLDACRSNCTINGACDPRVFEPRCDQNVLVTCEGGAERARSCGDLACSAGAVRCATCGDGVLDPGEECDYPDLADGDGCDRNCTFSVCGNGVLAPDEVCDDGNDDGGDGCRGDCAGREVCGDGVFDDHRGEACDDGNTVGGDGLCAADCRSAELCAADGCDDMNICTEDSCDPLVGCANAAITCEDNNPCTAEFCDSVLGCVFPVVDAAGCCNDRTDCDDGDVCTREVCHERNCRHIPVADCCHEDGDCPPEDCELPFCLLEENSCAHTVDYDACPELCATNKVCDGFCVPQGDVEHGCGPDSCTPCLTPEHGVALCDGDACAIGCELGYKQCGPADCVPSDDPRHGCEGDSCDPCPFDPATEIATCRAPRFGDDRRTQCSRICRPGHIECAGRCVLATPQNGCGGSADCTPCDAPADRAAPTCGDRVCAPGACLFGRIECGGACVQPTIENGCGASPSGEGQDCAPCADRPNRQLLGCDVDGCAYAGCDVGFDDLDGEVANGCETVTPVAGDPGLVAWWRAGAWNLVPEGGTSVVANLHDLTGGPRTLRVEDGFGRPGSPFVWPELNGPAADCVVFDGDFPQSRALVSNPGGALPLAGSDYTIFAVVRPLARRNGNVFFASGTLGAGSCGGHCPNEYLNMGWHEGNFHFDQAHNLFVFAPPLVTEGATRFMAALDVGVRRVFSFNSVEVSDASWDTSALTTGAGVVAIGGDARVPGVTPDFGGPRFGGWVCEILVYDRFVEGPERAGIDTYLARRWYEF